MIFTEAESKYLRSFLQTPMIEGRIPRHIVKMNHAILKRSGLTDEYSSHRLGTMPEVEALLDLLVRGQRGEKLSRSLRLLQRVSKDDPKIVSNLGKIADAVDAMSKDAK